MYFLCGEASRAIPYNTYISMKRLVFVCLLLCTTCIRSCLLEGNAKIPVSDATVPSYKPRVDQLNTDLPCSSLSSTRTSALSILHVFCHCPLSVIGQLLASEHDQVRSIRISFRAVKTQSRVASPTSSREKVSRNGKLHTRLMP
jgi:hypothetical protein